MKPFNPFGLRRMFLVRFVSKTLMNLIIFDQMKEPAAGWIFFRFQKFRLKFQPKFISPQTKNLGYALGIPSGVKRPLNHCKYHTILYPQINISMNIYIHWYIYALMNTSTDTYIHWWIYPLINISIDKYIHW